MKNKTTNLPQEFVYDQPEVDLSNIDEAIAKSEQNFELLKSLGEKAEKEGFEVLGGYFFLPVADGRVWHQAVAYNKQAKLYFVKRCNGICLDEYFDSYIGEGEWLNADWVEARIKGQKAMEKLFSKSL